MRKVECLPKLFVLLIAGGILLAGLSPVRATPIQLTAAQFATNTGPLAVFTEDFEGFSVGIHSAPFVIGNGTFNSVTPLIASTTVFCTFQSRCLIDKDSVTGSRIFSVLPTGTQFWGADLDFINLSDLFDVTVIGTSGVLNLLSVSLGPFIGFFDSSGLTSISFTNRGRTGGGVGNYSFDNIQTAGVIIPEPASLALFAIGLAGLGFFGQRRKLT